MVFLEYQPKKNTSQVMFGGKLRHNLQTRDSALARCSSPLRDGRPSVRPCVRRKKKRRYRKTRKRSDLQEQRKGSHTGGRMGGWDEHHGGQDLRGSLAIIVVALEPRAIVYIYLITPPNLQPSSNFFQEDRQTRRE